MNCMMGKQCYLCRVIATNGLAIVHMLLLPGGAEECVCLVMFVHYERCIMLTGYIYKIRNSYNDLPYEIQVAMLSPVCHMIQM